MKNKVHLPERTVNQIVELRAQEKLYEQHIHNIQAARPSIDISHPAKVLHIEKAQKLAQKSREIAMLKGDRLYAKIPKHSDQKTDLDSKANQNSSTNIKKRFTNQSNSMNYQSLTLAEDYAITTKKNWIDEIKSSAIYGDESKRVNELDITSLKDKKKQPISSSPKSKQSNYRYRYFNDNCVYCFEATKNIGDDEKEKEEFENKYPDPELISTDSFFYNTSSDQAKDEIDIENDKEYDSDDKLIKELVNQRCERLKSMNSGSSRANGANPTKNVNNNYKGRKKIDQKYMKFNSHYRHENKSPSKSVIINHNLQNSQDESSKASNEFVFQNDDFYKFTSPPVLSVPKTKNHKVVSPQKPNMVEIEEEEEVGDEDENELNESQLKAKENRFQLPQLNLSGNDDAVKSFDNEKNGIEISKDQNNLLSPFQNQSPSNVSSSFRRKIAPNKNNDDNQNDILQENPQLNMPNESSIISSPMVSQGMKEDDGSKLTEIGLPSLNSNITPKTPVSPSSNSLSPQTPILIGSPMDLNPMKIFPDYQSPGDSSNHSRADALTQTPTLIMEESSSDLDLFSSFKENIDLLTSPDFKNKRKLKNEIENKSKNKVLTPKEDLKSSEKINHDQKKENILETSVNHQKINLPIIQQFDNAINKIGNQQKDNLPKSNESIQNENTSKSNENPQNENLNNTKPEENVLDKKEPQPNANVPNSKENQLNFFLSYLNSVQPNESSIKNKDSQPNSTPMLNKENQPNDNLQPNNENRSEPTNLNPLINLSQKMANFPPKTTPIPIDPSVSEESSSRLFLSSSSMPGDKKKNITNESKQKNEQQSIPSQQDIQNKSLSQKDQDLQPNSEQQKEKETNDSSVIQKKMSQNLQEPASPSQFNTASSITQKDRHHHHHHHHHHKNSRPESPKSPNSRSRYDIESLQRLPTGELYSKTDKIEKPIKTVDENGNKLPTEQTLSVRPHSPKRHVSVPDKIPKQQEVTKKSKIPQIVNVDDYKVPYGFVEVKDEERESYIAKRITKKRKRFKKKKGVPPILEYKEEKLENIRYKIYSKGENVKNKEKDELSMNDEIKSNDFTHSKEKKKHNRLYIRDILLFNNKEVDPKILEDEQKRELQSDASTESNQIIEEEEDKIEKQEIKNNKEEEEKIPNINENEIKNSNEDDYSSGKNAFSFTAPTTPSKPIPLVGKDDKQMTQLIQNQINQLINENSASDSLNQNSKIGTSQPPLENGKKKLSRKEKRGKQTKKEEEEEEVKENKLNINENNDESNNELKSENEYNYFSSSNDDRIKKDELNLSPTQNETKISMKNIIHVEEEEEIPEDKNKFSVNDSDKSFNNDDAKNSTKNIDQDIVTPEKINNADEDKINDKNEPVDDKNRHSNNEEEEEEEEFVSSAMKAVDNDNKEKIESANDKSESVKPEIESKETNEHVENHENEAGDKTNNVNKEENEKVTVDSNPVTDKDNLADNDKNNQSNSQNDDEEKSNSNAKESDKSGKDDLNEEKDKNSAVNSEQNDSDNEKVKNNTVNKDKDNLNENKSEKAEDVIKNDDENKEENDGEKANESDNSQKIENAKENDGEKVNESDNSQKIENAKENDDEKANENDNSQKIENAKEKDGKGENSNENDKEEGKVSTDEIMIESEHNNDEPANKSDAKSKADENSDIQVKSNEDEVKSNASDRSNNESKTNSKEVSENEIKNNPADHSDAENKSLSDSKSNASNNNENQAKIDQNENKNISDVNKNESENNANEDSENETKPNVNDHISDENKSIKNEGSENEVAQKKAESSNSDSKSIENKDNDSEIKSNSSQDINGKTNSTENSKNESNEKKEEEEENNSAEVIGKSTEKKKEISENNKNSASISENNRNEEEENNENEENSSATKTTESEKSVKSNQSKKSSNKSNEEEEERNENEGSTNSDKIIPAEEPNNSNESNENEVLVIEEEEEENESNKNESRSQSATENSVTPNNSDANEIQINSSKSSKISEKGSTKSTSTHKNKSNEIPKNASDKNSQKSNDEDHSNATNTEVESEQSNISEKDDDQVPVFNQIAQKLLNDSKGAASNELPTEVTISFELVNNNNETKSSPSDSALIRKQKKQQSKSGSENQKSQQSKSNSEDKKKQQSKSSSENQKSQQSKSNSEDKMKPSNKSNSEDKKKQPNKSNSEDKKNQESKSNSEDKKETLNSNSGITKNPSNNEIIEIQNENVKSEKEKEKSNQTESYFEEEEEDNDYEYYSYTESDLKRPTQYERLTESISESMRSNKENENKSKTEKEKIKPIINIASSSRGYAKSEIDGEDEKASSEISNEETFHFEGENSKGQKYSKKGHQNHSHHDKKTKIVPPSKLPFKILSQSPSASTSISEPATSSPPHSKKHKKGKKSKDKKNKNNEEKQNKEVENKSNLAITTNMMTISLSPNLPVDQKKTDQINSEKKNKLSVQYFPISIDSIEEKKEDSKNKKVDGIPLVPLNENDLDPIDDDIYTTANKKQYFFVVQNNLDDTVTIPPNTINENQNSTNTEITHVQTEIDSLKESDTPSLSSSPLKPPPNFQSPRKVNSNKSKTKKKVTTDKDGIQVIGSSPLRQKGGGNLEEITERFLKAKVVSPNSKNTDSDVPATPSNVSLSPSSHKVEMAKLIYQNDYNDEEPSPVANFSALAQMSHMNKFLRETTPKRIRSQNQSRSQFESPISTKSSPAQKRGNEKRSPARNTVVRWIH